MEVYKILVVGEPQTGKSQIITSFFNCEQLIDKMSKPTTFTKNMAGSGGGAKDSSMDFVFQIVNISGRKVRV